MSLMQEYKVLILIFIVILFVGFVSANEDKVVINKEIKAKVPVLEIGKFVGTGLHWEAGKTYYEDGKRRWGITTLAVLNKSKILDFDAYDIKIFCGESYSFTGKIILKNGDLSRKLQGCDDRNYVSTFRKSMVYIDENYIIDLKADEGYLIEKDITLDKEALRDPANWDSLILRLLGDPFW